MSAKRIPVTVMKDSIFKAEEILLPQIAWKKFECFLLDPRIKLIIITEKNFIV